MTYQETVEWMFRQLPVYQLQGASAYKEDLGNITLLCEHLDNPQKNLQCIHVAGTNGKGSTSHMLASILQEAGYKTGLFTSPHLKDFRERIKINGDNISEDFITDFISAHRNFFEANALSFFEMTAGLAFDYFNDEKVDIAIIETGLGGRLDATNIIAPLLSVITNIGLDHVHILGNSVPAIAREKAGIIKPNVPVVIGEYTNETKAVFLAKADDMNADIYFASDLVFHEYDSDLKGDYQIHNKKTVVQAIAVLASLDDVDITETHITNGLLHVIQNTGLMGRWQQLGSSPTIICDTAHNKDGLEMTLRQVRKQRYDKLHIVLGVVNDKDLDEILPLFPTNAAYYFCKPGIPRGLDATILKDKASAYHLHGKIFASVADAYAKARNNAHEDDFIFVGGSTFVVAEVL